MVNLIDSSRLLMVQIRTGRLALFTSREVEATSGDQHYGLAIARAAWEAAVLPLNDARDG
jgi:hypothetical protein